MRRAIAALLLACLGVLFPLAATPVRLCLLEQRVLVPGVSECGLTKSKCCPDCGDHHEEKPCCVDLEDLPADVAGALGFIYTGTRGLFDSEDADTLYEGMVPGSAVVALAIEHRWAVDLVNALAANGVEVALNFRVPAPIIDEALALLTLDSAM